MAERWDISVKTTLEEFDNVVQIIQETRLHIFVGKVTIEVCSSGGGIIGTFELIPSGMESENG